LTKMYLKKYEPPKWVSVKFFGI